jgi:hypothetical protein
MMQGGGGDDIGGLIEGITGAVGEGAAPSGDVPQADEIELPSSGESKEFTECLSEAKSASDVQECATLME